jgi:RNA-directed DNA polymerase
MCGRNLAQIVKELSVYLIGWRGYFGFCQTPSVLRKLDEWLRRRLRAIAWKQWKHGRARCDVAASAGTWRHRPPEALMAHGGSATAQRSPSRCQTPTSDHSA